MIDDRVWAQYVYRAAAGVHVGTLGHELRGRWSVAADRGHLWIVYHCVAKMTSDSVR